MNGYGVVMVNIMVSRAVSLVNGYGVVIVCKFWLGYYLLS